jgi:hypothetical protein
MITMRDFMEVINYRITEGSDYGWDCFGNDAHSISYWNGDYDGHSFNLVFDTKDQTVYSAEICDYKRQRAYRLINPEFKTAHDKEAKNRDVLDNQAWDDVNFIDLESDDDWIEKATAIVEGRDYDTRIIIPVNLPDDVLYELMKQAHDRDITLNQHFENILKVEIDRVLDEHGLRDEYDFSNAEEGPVEESLKKLKKKKKKDQ